MHKYTYVDRLHLPFSLWDPQTLSKIDVVLEDQICREEKNKKECQLFGLEKIPFEEFHYCYLDSACKAIYSKYKF